MSLLSIGQRVVSSLVPSKHHSSVPIGVVVGISTYTTEDGTSTQYDVRFTVDGKPDSETTRFRRSELTLLERHP